MWRATAVFLGAQAVPLGRRPKAFFTCKRHADIFGYTGDVVFPGLVLGQIVEAADAALLFKVMTALRAGTSSLQRPSRHPIIARITRRTRNFASYTPLVKVRAPTRNSS